MPSRQHLGDTMHAVRTAQDIMRDIPTDSNGHATIGHRPPSNVRSGLSAFILRSGTCAVCGGTATEVLHGVAAGPARRGYVAGNLFPGCRPCNSAQNVAERNGVDIVATVHLFARVDLIDTVWPTMSELVAMATVTESDDDGAYTRRQTLGLPY